LPLICCRVDPHRAEIDRVGSGALLQEAHAAVQTASTPHCEARNSECLIAVRNTANFPVDRLYSSFDALYGAFENIVASFSESEKDKLFHDNALRTYRL
jgi:hypothetical protein